MEVRFRLRKTIAMVMMSLPHAFLTLTIGTRPDDPRKQAIDGVIASFEVRTS